MSKRKETTGRLNKKNKTAKPKISPIAIVGIGAFFPGSKDACGYWRDILTGRDMITEIPPTHWLIDDCYDPDPLAPDKTYCKTGAFLSPIDFDPIEFGIPPTNLASTDTSQLLALIVAKQVLEDAAQGQFSKMDRDRISVIIGVAAGLELLGEMASRLGRPIWIKALREEGIAEDQAQIICNKITDNYQEWKESTFPGLLGNVVAGRIANHFDIGGTNCTSDSACASSFSALSMALNELWMRQSDLVITGGVDTTNDPFLYVSFSKTPALSRTGDCRPFSEDSDGMVLGEGLGMIALKRLEDAERDGDRIYAIIRGIGTSSDGSGTSIYSPLPKGQAKALRRCYDAAGYSPSTVELIEAHGTGTLAGDVVEVEALSMIFDETAREDRQWCALGSVKSQIGHTKSAAAAAGIIKAIMALHNKILPPTIKVKKPDPKLNIENSPFYLNTETRPWIRDDSYPRRASVSSFGFGGTNFHVTMEEYRGSGKRAWRHRTFPNELFLLSAKDVSSLIKQCQDTITNLDEEGIFLYIVKNSQIEFKHELPAKLAIISTDENDLKAKINQSIDAIPTNGSNPLYLPNGIYYNMQDTKPGPIAFLFPGQGSQYLGMGAELAMYIDDVREIWDLSASIPMDGENSLHEIVFPRPVFSEDKKRENIKRLTSTEWAQPAISTMSLAMLALIKSLGLQPVCVGGHSLGEVTALFEAGVLDEMNVITLARKRGELMASASSVPGSMTAVPESLEKIQPLLDNLESDVIIANHNSPKQVVLSGSTSSIEVAEEALAKEKIKSKRLQVSTAFHSSIMNNSCAPFLEFLKDIPFNKPKIKIYSNAEASLYPDNEDNIREVLTKQINHPVRFLEQIEAMYAAGARTFIEVGPGSVLTKLVKQCLEGRPHLAVNMDNATEHGITSLWKALGQLAVNGIEIDYSYLWKDYAPKIDPREKEKPKLTIPIMGCNYNRPYPPEGGSDALPKPNISPIQKNNMPSTSLKTNPDAVRDANIDIPNSSDNLQLSSGNIENSSANLTTSLYSQPEGSMNNTVKSTPTTNQLDHTQGNPQPSIMNTDISNRSGKNNYGSWITAFQEIQRQTAETHSAFQKTMAESHMAFLKAAEASTITLNAMITGNPIPAREERLGNKYPEIPDQHEIKPHPSISNTLPQKPLSESITQDMAIPTSEVKKPVPVDIDFKEMLLDVVAEKTGYPKEILTIDMGLEADLGIDSIKRVEILSAIKDQSPWLPEVDPSEMANIKTLGDVLSFIEEYASAAPNSVPSPSVSVNDNVDFKEMLLDVVAEKTGYPKEILTIDMGLEADLGIDSIKRVEILSAIKDQSPWLPEVDPSEMANIKTLGDVLSFIEEYASAAPSVIPPPDVAVNDNIDFKEMLLDVVAEKTGYPKEILTIDMGLEADLGIDSIKRVEILSAVKDQSPWLPEIDPSEMANIKTLGDVLSYIEEFSSNNDNTKDKDVSPTEFILKDESSETSSARTRINNTQQSEIGRYALREVPAPYSGFSMKGLSFDCSVAVTDDGNGVAQSMIHKLNERGLKANITDDIPDNVDILIFLGGLKKIDDDDSIIAVNKEAFLASQRVAERFASSGGIFITVQDTGGDFGLSGKSGKNVYLGGLPGLVKTAALEWDNAAVKAIDIERGSHSDEEIAESLIQELFDGGPEIEVGLHADGKRTRLDSYAVKPNIGDSSLTDQSVIVASGGARGVTARTLIELACQFHPRIVLLGRTPLIDEPSCCRDAMKDSEIKRSLLDEAKSEGRTISPSELGALTRQILANREISYTLKRLEEAGSNAKYMALDVQDASALGKELESIRQEWGPITGIIHGAGVLNDKLIAQKTSEQFDTVFNTKVNGLRSLLKATENDPLELICLFSSVAARFGNMGQCDYAMANEILNKIANQEALRRKNTCIVKSINWGPWDGGMVSPQLKSHFTKLGIPLIPMDVGAHKLVDEIRERDPQRAEIVIGPPPPKGGLSVKTSNRMELRLTVSNYNYPFINSHKIEDIPVIPVVMVLEWFSRAAHLFYPDMNIVLCKDLRVMKGIKLDSFPKDAHNFILSCNINANGGKSVLSMELHGMEGPPHYTATIEMTDSAKGNGRTSTRIMTSNLRPWSLNCSEIYNDQLFHGPDFQVIQSLEGVSDQAATAIIVGTREKGWPGELWKTDAAALDGGLQLALLWGAHKLGKKSLPTKIGTYISYHDGLVKGSLRCELKGEVIGKDHTLSDILFFNEEEKLVAEMCDVEMHMLPN